MWSVDLFILQSIASSTKLLNLKLLTFTRVDLNIFVLNVYFDGLISIYWILQNYLFIYLLQNYLLQFILLINFYK